ncbi:hypothetical protein M9458_000577, partial [Cirrhinus mrigala]
EEVKEEERMEVENEEHDTEENIVGSAEDAPKTITDGGPTGVKTSTDPTSPDMEVEPDNGTDSPMTSEGKSQSSSSLETSNQCSLQQEVDVGGSE